MRFGYTPYSHLTDWEDTAQGGWSDFHCGLDLGQVRDWSVLAGLERTCEPGKSPVLACRFLRRWVGQSYLQVIEDVVAILSAGPLAAAKVAVDNTGCGRPVCDVLRQRLGTRLLAVTLTAGSCTTYEPGSASLNVPKRDLAHRLLVEMEAGRLLIARGMSETETLVRELQQFRVKVRASGWEAFEAAGSGHDDCVISLALSVLSASRVPAYTGPTGPVLLTPPRQEWT